MTIQCEFCGEPNVENHLLVCKMVLSDYFGKVNLVCDAGTNISLVTCQKNIGRLKTVRWRTIDELLKALVKLTNPPDERIYI